jgi:hypothetical protein
VELSEEKSQVHNSVIKREKNKENKQNRLGQMIELANEIESERERWEETKIRAKRLGLYFLFCYPGM